MSRRHRAAVLGAALVATAGLLVFLVSGPAAADSYQLQLQAAGQSGWSHDLAVPLLEMKRLAPGSTASGMVRVRNNSDETATLALQSVGVTDAAGCYFRERTADGGCQGTAGTLGAAMVFRVFVDSSGAGTFPGAPAWSGTIYDLAHAPVLNAQMPAHGTWGLRVDAALPGSVGNEVQGASLDFGLKVSLASAVGGVSTQVLGEKFGPGSGSSGGLLGFLARTGADTLRWFLVAVDLLVLGVAGVVLARFVGRRRRRGVAS